MKEKKYFNILNNLDIDIIKKIFENENFSYIINELKNEFKMINLQTV